MSCMVFAGVTLQGCTSYIIPAHDSGARQIILGHPLWMLTPIPGASQSARSDAAYSPNSDPEVPIGLHHPCWRQMRVNQEKTIFIRC